MIVPSSRLLAWVAWIGLPAALVASVFSEAAALAWGVLVLLLLGIVSDALLSRKKLSGIQVSAGESVSLFKDRPAELDLDVHHPGLSLMPLRLGLPLPAEISSPEQGF